MAATAGLRLTLDPMGKCSNAFFSKTTNMIKAKLIAFKSSPLKPLNQIKPNLAGVVPFQNCVRQPCPPFKMAAVTKNINFFNCPLLL